MLPAVALAGGGTTPWRHTRRGRAPAASHSSHHFRANQPGVDTNGRLTTQRSVSTPHHAASDWQSEHLADLQPLHTRRPALPRARGQKTTMPPYRTGVPAEAGGQERTSSKPPPKRAHAGGAEGARGRPAGRRSKALPGRPPPASYSSHRPRGKQSVGGTIFAARTHSGSGLQERTYTPWSPFEHATANPLNHTTPARPERHRRPSPTARCSAGAPLPRPHT